MICCCCCRWCVYVFSQAEDMIENGDMEGDAGKEFVEDLQVFREDAAFFLSPPPLALSSFVAVPFPLPAGLFLRLAPRVACLDKCFSSWRPRTGGTHVAFGPFGLRRSVLSKDRIPGLSSSSSSSSPPPSRQTQSEPFSKVFRAPVMPRFLPCTVLVCFCVFVT